MTIGELERATPSGDVRRIGRSGSAVRAIVEDNECASRTTSKDAIGEPMERAPEVAAHPPRSGGCADVTGHIEINRLIDEALKQKPTSSWKQNEDVTFENNRLMSEILKLVRQGLRPIGVQDLAKRLRLDADHGLRLLRYLVAKRALKKTDLKSDVIATIGLGGERSKRSISQDITSHQPEGPDEMISRAAQVIAGSPQPPDWLVRGLKVCRSRIYAARNAKPIDLTTLRSEMNKVRKAADCLLSMVRNETLRCHLLGGSPPTLHKKMEKIHAAAKTLLEMLRGTDVQLLVQILGNVPIPLASTRRDAPTAIPNAPTAISNEEQIFQSLKSIAERAQPLSIGGNNGRPKKTLNGTKYNAVPHSDELVAGLEFIAKRAAVLSIVKGQKGQGRLEEEPQRLCADVIVVAWRALWGRDPTKDDIDYQYACEMLWRASQFKKFKIQEGSGSEGASQLKLAQNTLEPLKPQEGLIGRAKHKSRNGTFFTWGTLKRGHPGSKFSREAARVFHQRPSLVWSKTELTREQAAEMLAERGFTVEAKAFAELAQQGEGPPYKLVGTRALYNVKELRKWALEAQKSGGAPNRRKSLQTI